jgi:outer membrane protein OmpA-like peptidoglycan-associated protein
MTVAHMTMTNRRTAPAALLTTALILTGCTGRGSNNEARTSSATTGAAVGAAVGTVAGAVIGQGTRGTLAGTAAGAAVGGAIGWLFAREETELKEVLAPQRAARTAEVEQVGEDTLKVTIDEAEAFEGGSSSIREAFLPTLDRVAGVLEKYPQSRVTVVGFTDAAGLDDANQRLSLERAEAVRGALATYGIDPDRVRAEGRGERDPVADNATQAGRAENRRLEILIAPVA